MRERQPEALAGTARVARETRALPFDYIVPAEAGDSLTTGLDRRPRIKKITKRMS